MKNENAETNLRNSSMKAGKFPKSMPVVEMDVAIDCICAARNEGISIVKEKAVAVLSAWCCRSRKCMLEGLIKELEQI